MTTPTLFPVESAVAGRQPKTDRLVLARLLKAGGKDERFDQDQLHAAHEILIRWADMGKSGRLKAMTETQWEGDFVAEVFGTALGYVGPSDEVDLWHRIAKQPNERDVPDVILGKFRDQQQRKPRVVVELKGPLVHLDRDRSNGRTAVDQCWHYLINTDPGCRWGIVSNMVSFRLYERDSTKRAYEHFALQDLRVFEKFREFYYLFHREGLLDDWHHGVPRAKHLLEESRTRQREVGDLLYETYSERRLELVQYLHHQLQYELDASIEMAQRLLDRIIFIAFCEDRGLLHAKTIARAHDEVPGFSDVTNPRWRNFKSLFRFIDKGNQRYNIPGYNGGLFAEHPVDELELPDEPWTGFFKTIGGYDFADEVNLDVLGHLFERSITELEKLKETGLFGDVEKSQRFAQMPQSAKRKQLGVYYTPPELTSRIVQYTVEELIDERFAAAAVKFGITDTDAKNGAAPEDADYWRHCLEILRALKIVDPACGSGAFLFQAYDVLEQRYHEVIGHLPADESEELLQKIPQFILQDNLYGVDLSPEAVEITQLALWIRSANRLQTLSKLSENIVHGNSLVHDVAVHPAGFDWRARFPQVFDREEAGFDCVIGNPPWERIKLQEREFFSLPAPEIATATNAAKRRALIAKLPAVDADLFARYETEQEKAAELLTYCRRSGEYPLTGRGDINTYAVFAELAYNLVAPRGRVGLLVPSGIASDKTTKDFFAAIAESDRLIRLFDFENRLKTFFPAVDGRFKFSILNYGGTEITVPHADFLFFAHKDEDLEEVKRHVKLSGDDIRLLNPNTRTCPIFRSRRDAEITKAIYRRVPVLIDRNREGPTRNPWGIRFHTMFHQTNDAELFREPETLLKDGFKLKRNRWVKASNTFLPICEAKMFQIYDHRAAAITTDASNWVRQGQTVKTTVVEHANPEFAPLPRFWIDQEIVRVQVENDVSHFICFKDVTSPTNQRTMIAAMSPVVGLMNSAPIMFTSHPPRLECCLLANLNSFAYDFVVRQKISNVHLNFFILEQIPTFPPDEYTKPCNWDANVSLAQWISERVLKLTCTAEDMLPLAEACDFTRGSFQREYGGRLNKWSQSERRRLMAELDGMFAHLYGLTEDEFAYILTTFPATPDPVKVACGNAYRDIERGLIS